ncbi:hypothetical protein [Nonomuraea diastatica]|uniref:Uncharacterized protein n=1 Tax=Nonomuraea diastatica TaxID=1848329 RepID=A0A4R4WD23_9ACTN|nr:hypothetical protein [Nonomuraea diastatica]TDD11320.1 hypothetical protein E1294_45320 [Nonomuraea diastatica]
MPDKTRNLLPEQQQPDEDQSAFHQRRRPWTAMTHAGTEIKTCRSRVATALDMLRGQLSGPSAYPVPELPAGPRPGMGAEAVRHPLRAGHDRRGRVEVADS